MKLFLLQFENDLLKIFDFSFLPETFPAIDSLVIIGQMVWFHLWALADAFGIESHPSPPPLLRNFTTLALTDSKEISKLFMQKKHQAFVGGKIKLFLQLQILNGNVIKGYLLNSKNPRFELVTFKMWPN